MVQEILKRVCKNFDNQPRSGRSKTVDSEAVLRAMEANLASCNRIVSGELVISQFMVICHLLDVGKSGK